MSIKYRIGQGTSASDFTDVVVKVGDTLPIGSEIDYDGQTAPAGWQEVDDPNVYSTSETKIGTWINGKPLYRKVVDVGTLPNNTTNEINVGLSNIVVRNMYGCATNSDNSYTIPIPFTHNNSSSALSLRFSVNKLILITQGDLSQYVSSYVVIEYTKTTD